MAHENQDTCFQIRMLKYLVHVLFVVYGSLYLLFQDIATETYLPNLYQELLSNSNEGASRVYPLSATDV